MRSLVLDLRGNGGGIVDQAVKVAENFLPVGTLVVTQRGRTRLDNRVWKSRNMNPEQMPLVVLVDEDTASASEIVAGALQDDDRAMIVGDKTFGKGLVQSVIDLPGSTGLTLTTGRYLTPSGRSIQRDYSRIQPYDYFNHKSIDAEIGRPYFEARTITDRKVFGGARELVNGRMAGFENYRALPLSFGKRVTAGDFPVSEELLAAFDDFAARQQNGKFSPNILRTSSSFIKLRLRFNIVMASFGAISANQVLIEDDSQVVKAVETLPRAAQLAQSAAIARKHQK
jgi:carboxyl-terminal processing protease